jgi:hypothetical protein
VYVFKSGQGEVFTVEDFIGTVQPADDVENTWWKGKCDSRRKYD